MITLYSFGPAFGLPDASPFVTKVELLLKMAKLLYRTDTAGLARAPKGKLPYIDDAGVVIPDSTFIRWHLEQKYRIDFDLGLDAAQRATAWTFEKMVEDQLYWALVHDRWMIDWNFVRGPARACDKLPWPLRPLGTVLIRRKTRRALHAHGLGRHSADDIHALGRRSINAIAAFLGDKPFFMGFEPTGIDATVFAFLCGVMCPYFDSRLRAAAERHANLRGYVGRMTALYYPGLSRLAGCPVVASRDGQVPAVPVPAVPVQLPAVQLPAVQVPAVQVPAVQVPAAQVPAVQVIDVQVRGVHVPDVPVPTGPGVLPAAIGRAAAKPGRPEPGMNPPRA